MMLLHNDFRSLSKAFNRTHYSLLKVSFSFIFVKQNPYFILIDVIQVVKTINCLSFIVITTIYSGLKNI